LDYVDGIPGTPQKRRAEFETPTHLICDVARRAVGRDPVGLTRVASGSENEVYRVDCARPPACFVRIRRYGDVNFSDEAWAIENFRQAGVPAAPVMLLDKISCGGSPLEVMVQEEAVGRPLSDLLATIEASALPLVFARVGEVLARMHSVRVAGFGRRCSGGTWAFATWCSFVMAKAETVARAEEQILRAGFPRDAVEFAIATLRAMPGEFPCSAAVLCHGDLVPEHIFLNDELNVSSVIDFGQIQGGPPLTDFVHLSFLRPSADIESVRSGYAHSALTPHLFDRQLHLHRLLFLLPCVAHITAMGDTAADKTPDAAGQLRKTLEVLQ